MVDAAKVGCVPPVDVSGPLASSRSVPLMCSTCPPMTFSSPEMSLSGPPMNISGHLVSCPSDPTLNVSGLLVSSSSGLCATDPLVNLSCPPMSSPSALNFSSDLASSSSGPQQLVHIPLSSCLSSNLPSRNCSPLSNLLNLPAQSEIP